MLIAEKEGISRINSVHCSGWSSQGQMTEFSEITGMVSACKFLSSGFEI